MSALPIHSPHAAASTHMLTSEARHKDKRWRCADSLTAYSGIGSPAGGEVRVKHKSSMSKGMARAPAANAEESFWSSRQDADLGSRAQGLRCDGWTG